MSGAPSCSMVWLTSCSRASGRARSARMATAVPPPARMSCTVSPMVPSNGEVPASVVRADTATAAPAAPNRRAISAPIPRLAPVTMATLPSRMPMPTTPTESNTRSKFQNYFTPAPPHCQADAPGPTDPGQLRQCQQPEVASTRPRPTQRATGRFRAHTPSTGCGQRPGHRSARRLGPVRRVRADRHPPDTAAWSSLGLDLVEAVQQTDQGWGREDMPAVMVTAFGEVMLTPVLGHNAPLGVLGREALLTAELFNRERHHRFLA